MLLWGFLSGTVLFAIVVPVLGMLQPGYSHATQQISQLGQAGAENAVVMRVATSTLGVSVVMFGIGIRLGIERDAGWTIGPALIVFAGLCLVTGGVFPCDPGCVPVTFTGRIHKTVSNIGFPAMIIAPFAVAFQLMRAETWRGYRLHSIRAGVLAALLVPVYVLELLPDWGGAIQRIILVVLLLWMAAVSAKLLRSSSVASPGVLKDS